VFQSIDSYAIGEIEVKRSRFIAEVFYIEDESIAKEKIDEIKKKYFDAKHHVFSYKIDNLERFSDDGEPQGTAGTPLLDIIKKRNLNNILVVVTRYFGGTLLGTGGLVKAYSDAFTLALENAKIVNKTNGIEYEIVANYENLEKIKYICQNNNITIKNIEYGEKITITLTSIKESYEALKQNYNLIENSKITNENIVINV
jgi:uncharacterized YigZ family protein